MKAVKLFSNVGLALIFGLFFSISVFAQTENPKTQEKAVEIENNAETKTETKKVEIKPVSTDADKATVAENVSGDEQEVLNYYANYLKEYRLGPNDVISVEVFGQC